MKVLTSWLRSYLPGLSATDAQLAEALTLRGIAAEGVFDLTSQHGEGAGSLFEMDITTNRVDAMNHYGIAREVAVIYGLQLDPIAPELPAEEPGAAFPVRVEPDAEALCGRFTARVLRDVRIAPSRGVVAERFRLLEQKQISNAVDATNYVTQAIGQPTHAFDLDRIEGGIVVRKARAGERLRMLDGVERTLHPDDLVIADERKALSLAGVMGGADSMITAETKNVLVEAAWFDPMSIRRSAKRHGLHTDASHRFERGADFEAAPAASALVSRILLEAGGFISGPFVDIRQPAAMARTVGRSPVRLRMREVHRILGPTEEPKGISASEATTILLGLGCAIAAGDAGEPGPEHALHGAFTTHDLQHGTALQIAPAAPHLPPVTQEVSVEPLHTPETPEGQNPGQGVGLPGSPSRDLKGDLKQDLERPDLPIDSQEAALGQEAALPDPARAHSQAQQAPAPAGVSDSEQSFQVTLPSWRLDLAGEVDLLEEIARVYGYNRFRNTLPVFTGSVRELPTAAPLRAIRRVLLASGFSEAVSSTFVSAADAQLFAAQPGTAVPMGNPLSEEAGMLRPALLPGMLTMLGQNLHRGVEQAALFELGHVFTGSGAATPTDRATSERASIDRVDERISLCFGAVGRLHGKAVDFFAAKGVAEAVAALFTSRLLYWDRFPTELGLMPAWLHPGRSARLVMDGSTIGFFGELHPEQAARRKVRAAVIVSELRVDRLLPLGLRHPVPQELSRFQPVRRDFSFLLRDEVPYGAVAEAIAELGIAELQRVEPAEVLRDATGARVPAGEYSLLLRTVFQARERTLQDGELQEWAQGIQTAVEGLGGRLRG